MSALVPLDDRLALAVARSHGQQATSQCLRDLRLLLDLGAEGQVPSAGLMKNVREALAAREKRKAEADDLEAAIDARAEDIAWGSRRETA